jgi:hypothetical protein
MIGNSKNVKDQIDDQRGVNRSQLKFFNIT